MSLGNALAEYSYSAGGYDWLAIWRRMYDDERNQAENATLPGFVAQPDCWSGQADRFAAAAQRAPQPDGFMRFLLPRLRPGDRLIDIGAGTGRYVSLLSGAVAELLAQLDERALADLLAERDARADRLSFRRGRDLEQIQVQRAADRLPQRRRDETAGDPAGGRGDGRALASAQIVNRTIEENER